MNNSIPVPPFEALLERVELFADLDQPERAAVSRVLTPFSARAGDLLFPQGAPATGIYLIEHGSVVVSAQLFGADTVDLGTFGPGSALGELALVDRQPRSASARAVEDSAGAFLDVHAFDGLRGWLHPSALKLLVRIARGMTDRLRDLASHMGPTPPVATVGVELAPECLVEEGDARLLRVLPKLQEFTDSELAELAKLGTLQEVRRGGVLARISDAQDRLYLVVRGVLELRTDLPPHGSRVALLGPGELTCQVSVLDPRPHSMVCVARETALVLALPSETLATLFAQCSSLSFRLADTLAKSATRTVRVASRRHAQLAGEVHAVVVYTSSS
jgi:CRP-like cAMP-binding protein